MPQEGLGDVILGVSNQLLANKREKDKLDLAKKQAANQWEMQHENLKLAQSNMQMREEQFAINKEMQATQEKRLQAQFDAQQARQASDDEFRIKSFELQEDRFRLEEERHKLSLTQDFEGRQERLLTLGERIRHNKAMEKQAMERQRSSLTGGGLSTMKPNAQVDFYNDASRAYYDDAASKIIQGMKGWSTVGLSSPTIAGVNRFRLETEKLKQSQAYAMGAALGEDSQVVRDVQRREAFLAQLYGPKSEYSNLLGKQASGYLPEGYLGEFMGEVYGVTSPAANQEIAKQSELIAVTQNQMRSVDVMFERGMAEAAVGSTAGLTSWANGLIMAGGAQDDMMLHQIYNRLTQEEGWTDVQANELLRNAIGK